MPTTTTMVPALIEYRTSTALWSRFITEVFLLFFHSAAFLVIPLLLTSMIIESFPYSKLKESQLVLDIVVISIH